MDEKIRKKMLLYLHERSRRLKKLKEQIIKVYWEKIKHREKYKDPDWYKK